MRPKRLPLLALIVMLAGIALLAGTVAAAPSPQAVATPTARATVTPHIATAEELQAAYAAWSASKHSETYDLGLGANTTCARCKSPQNWDPSNSAVGAALDCAACKRTPGAPRPELQGGVSVPLDQWKHIGCEICHQPAGDSYWTSLSYWDQSTQSYLPVESTAELCAKCHEGQHGFEVIVEQAESPAHRNWECTACHGAHGQPSSCLDCHDPKTNTGAPEHARHPSVNCTACHDQGGLSVWVEQDPLSKHYQKYITRRFAHTITSWPSHNLSRNVNCLRCHHPLGGDQPIVAQTVSCKACHPDGEVWFWCAYFPRNPDPYPTPAVAPAP